MMKKVYLKPAMQVEAMTESVQILAGSLSEVTSVDSNLDDDNLIWGGEGDEEAR